jgi:hypothetical protein
MLSFLLIPFLTMSTLLPEQTPPTISVETALSQSLAGRWVGVLEYRDYSEPAASTRRVDLPTWLTIFASGSSMRWNYVYDDGPNKVLEEADVVIFDSGSKSYSESTNGKSPTTDQVDGYDTLKDGRGVLVLHGRGRDNDLPSETRTTITIRRNLLELVEEVRSAGSSDAFAFRHLYRFTRALPPAVTR